MPNAGFILIFLLIPNLFISPIINSYHTTRDYDIASFKDERIIKQIEGHFTDNRGRQLVIWSINKSGTHTLRAFIQKDNYWHCIAEGHHRHITNIQAGDINGDNKQDIVVELLQPSKLDPIIKPRIFIYSVDSRGYFRPLWRGSSLSRPFRRYLLFPQNSSGLCYIAAIEKNTLPEYKNFEWLGIYKWNGFGLKRVWDTPVKGMVQILEAGYDKNGPFLKFKQVNGSVIRSIKIHKKNSSFDENYEAFLVK